MSDTPTHRTQVAGRERKQRGKKRGAEEGRPSKHSRQWVVKKKEQMRKRGYENIPVDTKYSGRKRRKVVV